MNPIVTYFDPVMDKQSLRGSTTEVEVLTLGEVAGYLRLSTKTVSRMARAGELPAFKAGNHWRVRRAELEDWIKRRMETGRSA